jgi:hypothetical protein
MNICITAVPRCSRGLTILRCFQMPKMWPHTYTCLNCSQLSFGTCLQSVQLFLHAFPICLNNVHVPIHQPLLHISRCSPHDSTKPMCSLRASKISPTPRVSRECANVATCLYCAHVLPRVLMVSMQGFLLTDRWILHRPCILEDGPSCWCSRAILPSLPKRCWSWECLRSHTGRSAWQLLIMT